MEGYGYPYGQFSPASPGGDRAHGDAMDYYNMQPLNSSDISSPTKNPSQRKRSRSASGGRSHSKSRSRSRTNSRSPSRSGSGSTRSQRSPRRHDLREPSFLDAFRVLYLTPSKSKKNTSKYLATKKRQDHIEEILKSDGLGSKRWLFYPRTSTTKSEPNAGKVPGARENSDQRIKIDGQFLRKYKRSKAIARDAPIAKLKRWELTMYKELGFIKAE